MRRKKTIGIICGECESANERMRTVAEDIGEILDQENYNLLYVGENKGLLEEVINRFKRPAPFDSSRHKKLSISQLVAQADAIVFLPGGVKTVLEMFQLINLKINEKPNLKLLLLNTDDFWNKTIDQIYEMKEKGLLEVEPNQLLRVVNSVYKLASELEELLPVEAERAGATGAEGEWADRVTVRRRSNSLDWAQKFGGGS